MAWVDFVMVNGRNDEHYEDTPREDLEMAVRLFLQDGGGVYVYTDASGCTVFIPRSRVHSARVGGV